MSLNLGFAKNVILECELNGKRHLYDAAASGDLDEAKEFYGKSFPVYIGSSNTIYIGGVKNVFKETFHFFIKKQISHGQP